MDKRLTPCAVVQTLAQGRLALQFSWEKAGCSQSYMFDKVLTVVVDTW